MSLSCRSIFQPTVLTVARMLLVLRPSVVYSSVVCDVMYYG